MISGVPSGFSLLFLPLAGVAVAILATCIMVRSIRGAAALARPCCGRCRHPIEPRSAVRCPECGADESTFWFGRRCVAVVTLIASMLLVATVLAAAVLLPRVLVRRSPWAWANAAVATKSDAECAAMAFGDGVEAEVGSEQLRSRFVATVLKRDDAADLVIAAANVGGTPGKGPLNHVARITLANFVSDLRLAGLDDARWSKLLEALSPPPRLMVRSRHRPGGDIEVRLPGQVNGGVLRGALSPGELRVDGVARAPIASRGSFLDSEGRMRLNVPDVNGVRGLHRIELDWIQGVFTQANSPQIIWPDKPIDMTKAEWTRSGTFEAEIEIVGDGEPIFELATDPTESPFGDQARLLSKLELRQVDSRMLVVVEAPMVRGPEPTSRLGAFLRREPPKGIDDLAVYGDWLVRQGDREVIVGQSRWPLPAGASFDRRFRSVLVEPALDPSKPMQIVFRPMIAEAEATIDVDRLWAGEIVIDVAPRQLRPVDGAFDPTWRWTP